MGGTSFFIAKFWRKINQARRFFPYISILVVISTLYCGLNKDQPEDAQLNAITSTRWLYGSNDANHLIGYDFVNVNNFDMGVIPGPSIYGFALDTMFNRAFGLTPDGKLILIGMNFPSPITATVIQQLPNTLAPTNYAGLEFVTIQGVPYLYAFDTGPTDRPVYRIAINGGTSPYGVEHLGSAGFDKAITGVTFDSTGNVLYAMDRGHEQLGTVNLITGAFTPQDVEVQIGIPNPRGLALEPGGFFYATFSTPNLGRCTFGDGHCTSIGSTTITKEVTFSHNGPGVLPTPTPTPVPIAGFADLHLHHTSYPSWFGGGWMHGDFQGAESVALSKCDGGTDHARLIFSGLPVKNCPLTGLATPVLNMVDTYLPRMMQKQMEAGDIGPHKLRTNGYHLYEGWPRWDGIGHQAVWEGWLKDAHDNGLKLIISAATDFRPLCNVIVPGNKKTGCDEMANVETQIDAANNFAATHSSWVQVAHSPLEARSIIASGKLAMVLKIETTDLFGDTPDFLTELNRYFNKGVRSLQLAHLMDDKFAGIAPINPVFDVLQFIEPVSGPQCHYAPDCLFKRFKTVFGPDIDVPGLGFDYDSRCYNRKGLTADGATLLNAMMSKNMLVDIAHLSQQAINDVYDITSLNNYYPIFMSHSDFRPLRLPGKRTERGVDTPTAEMIGKSGGMVGLLPDADETRSYTGSVVPNRCFGSARNFAQQYEMGVEAMHLNIALGTDLNCFTAHARPRFGNLGACSDTKLVYERVCQRKYEKTHADTKTNSALDDKGFAHVGLEDELVAQLGLWGVDTSNLNQSAENFIQMWERIYNRPAGPVPFPHLDPNTIDNLTYHKSPPERAQAFSDAFNNCKALGGDFHCNENCNERKECREFCRDEKKECKKDCKTVKGECKETCKDDFQACKDACSSPKCRKACRQTKKSCKKVCKADKQECKDTCKGDKKVCKKDCRHEGAEFCQVECSDSMDSCACPNFFSAIGY